MLQDVTTWWNPTFDMLSFVVKYRKAIEHITSDLKNDLHKYELTDTEWRIADELKEMLKVSFLLFELHSHVINKRRSYSESLFTDYNLYLRFSKTALNSFRVGPPTWPQLSQLWTISTWYSPMRSSPTATLIQQFVMPFVLPRKY